jgi:outer membrane immunogenic protein
MSGGLIGGAVGYNFQVNRWVLGVEADDSWASITGSGTCGFGGAAPHACGGGIENWLATVRGRLGYDVGQFWPGVGDTMLYIAGGLAVGEVHAWDSLFGASGSTTATGWTFGGGIETKLSPNWSVKLEYLHIDLGDPAVFTAIPPNPEHVSTTADIVRVGVSYYFNAPPPPPAPAPILTKAPPVSK